LKKTGIFKTLVDADIDRDDPDDPDDPDEPEDGPEEDASESSSSSEDEGETFSFDDAALNNHVHTGRPSSRRDVLLLQIALAIPSEK
jgi:hypothetical protein